MSSEPEGARDFHVTTVREIVVAAPEPPPEQQRLRLSSLDFLLPETTFSVCSCFKKPNKMFVPGFGLIAHTIERALRKVLVTYYPMAGEVVTGASGESELLCNNRGVDLVLASADVELRQLNFHLPHLSIAKFVPTKKQGVLVLQVTELRCGSVVIGCTIDHRFADGYSANMFFVSLIEVILSQPLSFVPSFERSLLSPRRPLLLDPSLDQMFMPVSSLPPPSHETSPQDALSSRIYYIESVVMEQLQALASSDGCQKTKLESLSAYLWKLVAKHAAKDDPSKITSRLGMAVDGRRRLAEEGNREMKTYFGNVVSIPFGRERISVLVEKPLCWVANEVHEFLNKGTTKDHFLVVIDWIESHRPEPVLCKIYETGCDDEGPALVVSSGKEFSMTRADFGWGPPVFGSGHWTYGEHVGYVMPTPSPANNGDWLVYLYLTKEQFNFVHEEASRVLKPVNGDYLGINAT